MSPLGLPDPAPTPLLARVCSPHAPCKCCGTPSPLYGVVDFHKNCEERRRKVLDLSGIPVYYHRCPQCAFLFTAAFDLFSVEDFRACVYDDDYALVDPDYEETRPRSIAAWLTKLLPGDRPARLLDYGCGNGLLAECLRSRGFPEVHCYDPFVPAFAAKPQGRFDCVCAFEVVEHSPSPLPCFAEMVHFLAETGLLLFSTLLQPADIDRQGLAWWYAAPRNGHVSLYSRQSLERIAQRLGMRFGSFHDGMHVFFRSVPAFAGHLFPAPPA